MTRRKRYVTAAERPFGVRLLSFIHVSVFEGFVEFDFGGFGDAETVADEEKKEILAGELIVLPLFVCGFELGHAFVSFEDDAGVHPDVDAMIPQFAQEAGVSVIDGFIYLAEVRWSVVKRVTVNVVDVLAFLRDVMEGAEDEKVHRIVSVLTFMLDMKVKVLNATFDFLSDLLVRQF